MQRVARRTRSEQARTALRRREQVLHGVNGRRRLERRVGCTHDEYLSQEQVLMYSRCHVAQDCVGGTGSGGGGGGAAAARRDRRDPRVWIVRHALGAACGTSGSGSGAGAGSGAAAASVGTQVMAGFLSNQ